MPTANSRLLEFAQESGQYLVTARLKYVADSEWGSRRYLDVTLLDE